MYLGLTLECGNKNKTLRTYLNYLISVDKDRNDVMHPLKLKLKQFNK